MARSGASEGSLLRVAMHGRRRKRRHAHRDVLRTFGLGAAVAHPFAGRSHHRLPRAHIRASRLRYSTRNMPRKTTVTSSNSGRCPGSTQPSGETMRATLTFACSELTRPTNSSICFGLLPAAATTVGAAMSLGNVEMAKGCGPRRIHAHGCTAFGSRFTLSSRSSRESTRRVAGDDSILHAVHARHNHPRTRVIH